MATIVIDAGHGGFDNGARYQGRREKDDNLRLALAVGNILKQRGYDVIYTRTDDIYQSPYEKAQIANEAGADYFVSFHRNSGENDNTYNGVQTLIYEGDSKAEQIAESINQELAQRGFANLGIEERTGLVVLRQTEMPAVLIEAGFINNDKDNEIFDEDFYGVANAIADGIENAVPLSMTSVDVKVKDIFYGVEIGRFKHFNTANFMTEQLKNQGFEVYSYRQDEIIHVIAGKEKDIDSAMQLQNRLRKQGYMTMVVTAEN